MYINAKNLFGLSVETKNGQKLGKIIDFDIDVESQIVRSYSVESGFLSSKKLVILRNQIISINKEKMIVEDGIVKEEIIKERKAIIKQKAEPVLSASIIKK